MEKVRIYCDGACSGNPGPGGWAGVLLFDDDKQLISGGDEDTTNNRMELKAAIESINLAIKMGFRKLDIYSDSSYLVNAIKNEWYKKWRINGWKTSGGEPLKNKDLWLEMLSLISETNVVINFIKVKGHSGNKYNELVDKYARKEVERLKK